MRDSRAHIIAGVFDCGATMGTDRQAGAERRRFPSELISVSASVSVSRRAPVSTALERRFSGILISSIPASSTLDSVGLCGSDADSRLLRNHAAYRPRGQSKCQCTGSTCIDPPAPNWEHGQSECCFGIAPTAVRAGALCLRRRRSRGQSVPAHDLNHLRAVRQAGGCGGRRLGRFAKKLRTDCGRRDRAEHLYVLTAIVVEPVNGKARNAQRLSRPHRFACRQRSRSARRRCRKSSPRSGRGCGPAPQGAARRGQRPRRPQQSRRSSHL